MSLLDQAAADLRAILTDSAGGFAVPITVTDPAGHTGTVNGLQTDIGHSIDPETGMTIAGRRVSVSLSIPALAAVGLGVPQGVPESNKKPWVVTFTPTGGSAQTFKVSEVLPDKLGIAVCILEVYRP